MKILFVSELLHGSRGSQRARAFEDLGYNIILLSTARSGKELHHKGSFWEKAFWKMGLPLDGAKVNRNILHETKKSNPDIIWIEKGNTIWPKTLRIIKSISPKTNVVSFSEDDMYAPHNRSLYYSWGLKHYDYVITTKSYNCAPDELPKLGARKVIFVDKAYDINKHRPMELSPQDYLAYGSEVGFIGSYETDRAKVMLYLAQHGVKIRIWGAGWRKMLGVHPNLIVENRPIYDDEYAKGICATKINLCFLRKMNRDLQTDRTLEIPACGGFMLAERTVEHLRLFAEGREAEYFGSAAEALEKIQYYLKNEEGRANIAQAGRARCQNSGYSHHQRLKLLLTKMGIPE
jgi:spore maturation protein CgeB